MDLRTTYLLHLRPECSESLLRDNMTEDERFQNETLRPIIKVQNPLILETFQHYIAKYKNVYHQLPLDKQLKYIEKAVRKDNKLRNTLKGMIIGLFTQQEYRKYLRHHSAINRRIMNLIVERLKDQMQLFTEDESMKLQSA